MIGSIEDMIKTELKTLKRLESKTMVQFLNDEGKFVCGYSEKPKQVHFYFQPLYDNPEAYAGLKEGLKAYLKGKSCLHIKHGDAASLSLIANMLKVYKSSL